jgi:hypothetical protein
VERAEGAAGGIATSQESKEKNLTFFCRDVAFFSAT